MANWSKFQKSSFPNRDDFYSKLNIEGITENDNKHTKIKVNISATKHLDAYPDLHVLNDTLL